MKRKTIFYFLLAVIFWSLLTTFSSFWSRRQPFLLSENENNAHHHQVHIQALNHHRDQQSSTVTRIYVIGFTQVNFDSWKLKNNEYNESNSMIQINWFQSVNGSDPSVINHWLNITGQSSKYNVQEYMTKFPGKTGYQSLHAVGCYLSHYNLWKKLDEEKRTEPAFFIFEDDATCADHMIEDTLKIIPHLPHDWDLLFLGGKAFTYFDHNTRKNRNKAKKLSLENTTFKKLVCDGKLGIGHSPLAPDGSRNISETNLYWQTTYLTNTDAYAVNPKRLRNILNVVDPFSTQKQPRPIDIVLAENMRSLNVYLTPREYCVQFSYNKLRLLKTPRRRIGYFHSFKLPKTGYHWGALYIPDCIGKY